MPILALANEQDAERLRRAATTNYERDLVETLLAMRGRYLHTIELIHSASKLILSDITGESPCERK